jgi:hypothetical protein
MAFQNWDYHGRNAIFHDLVNYSWPVIYPNGGGLGQPLIMSYYLGFWLPSSLVGKLFGWEAANFALFAWTFLGAGLIITLVSRKTHIPLSATAIFVIFFSGMDILGTLLRLSVAPDSYPTLWPGTSHLEWWAAGLQYSAFTTLIYWVFNQSIPILLGMALLINDVPIQHLPLLASLCFFLGPLPTIGMLIYFVPIFIVESIRLHKDSGVLKSITALAKNLLTFETVIGFGSVFLISMAYFSANQAIQKRTLQYFNPIYVLLFFLIEGGLLWLLLFVFVRKDFLWVITGVSLLCIPFVKLGNNQDFVWRASIAPIFFLMTGIGIYLRQNYRTGLAKIILICLLIGAVTPIHEFHRSVTRTLNYYFALDLPVASSDLYADDYSVKHFILFVPELDHPDTLMADDLKTLAEPFGWRDNFVGDLKGSLFYQYLMASR